FRDLRMKLFIDPEDMKRQYEASPPWLKTLMNACADGLNYYLATHPAVKPRVITRFEPWMALTFTEGSIGGDIETVSIPNLRGVLWRTPPERGERRRAAALPGSVGLQRHRDRAVEHRGPQGAAADQPPHLVLLPRGSADVERRGAQRLRRGDVGAILRLPGLQ